VDIAPARTIGEVIHVLYERFLDEFGDPELASVATAAVINDLLTTPRPGAAPTEEAA
jgi:hypothetical protein